MEIGGSGTTVRLPGGFVVVVAGLSGDAYDVAVVVEISSANASATALSVVVVADMAAVVLGGSCLTCDVGCWVCDSTK